MNHPTHSAMTNIHTHDKDTFSSQSLLMQHQGFTSTKRFGIPIKGVFSEAGRALPPLWEREGCSLHSMSCKPVGAESSTEHKPWALPSSAGRALLSRGNSAPCEKSHYSHLGLFLPRKFQAFDKLTLQHIPVACYQFFLSVETSVFC